MNETPPLPGQVNAPAASAPSPAYGASFAPVLWAVFKRILGTNPRRARATSIALTWGFIWVMLSILTRTGADGDEAAYADARSRFIYWMWMISVAAAISLNIYVWAKYKRISVVERMVIPNALGLLIWLLVMHATLEWRSLNLIIMVVGTFIWWSILCTLPIWPAEMENGYVYYHRRYSAQPDDFDFVMRPLLKVDHQRLVELADAGISFDQLRLYLNAGAPVYLRDELSASLLGQYFGELQTLSQNFSTVFRAPNFKPEPFDVPFTQANIQHTFATYRTGAKELLQRYILAESQRPDLASAAPHIQARQLAQRAVEAVEALYNKYKRDVTRLTRLFVDSDDPLLMPNTLYWITAFDEWRMFWNKNVGVPVTVNLTGLRTRENLEFDLKVFCVCQFEPEKIRKPDKRDRVRKMKDEAEIKKWISDSVSGFIPSHAHRYFQVQPTQVTLETGADDYQKLLSKDFNAGQNGSTNIKMIDPTVDCDVIPPYEVGRVRRQGLKQELRDEQEASQLRRLLSVSDMSPEQQAETMMRIMMMRYLPEGLQQFPREMLPGMNQQITIQPPPLALPPGDQFTIQPPNGGDAGRGRGRQKDDTQTRRRLNLNQLDDNVIDLRPDEDDPNTYRPRQ